MTIQITQRLIPKTFTNIRPGIPMQPEYITIHETANVSKGADAQAHARLLERGNTRTASWHFTVDDKEVIQHIPTDEVAWHAGDSRNGTGNRKSIGIEICVNEGGNYDKAVTNAVELVKNLLAKHNIPANRVVPHHHWTGKNCPARLLKNWPDFLAKVAEKPKETTKHTSKFIYKRMLQLTKPMMRGDDVKLVQKRLGVPTDGWFGSVTRNAVITFQRKHKLAIDGIVGPITWKSLFS